MICRVSDMRYKDVVNIRDGCRLGYVSDIEIDTNAALVCSIVIYGRARLFGLLGREDDIIIPWCDIDIIGEDIILVNMPLSRTRRGRKGIWESFAG